MDSYYFLAPVPPHRSFGFLRSIAAQKKERRERVAAQLAARPWSSRLGEVLLWGRRSVLLPLLNSFFGAATTPARPLLYFSFCLAVFSHIVCSIVYMWLHFAEAGFASSCASRSSGRCAANFDWAPCWSVSEAQSNPDGIILVPHSSPKFECVYVGAFEPASRKEKKRKKTRDSWATSGHSKNEFVFKLDNFGRFC